MRRVMHAGQSAPILTLGLRGAFIWCACESDGVHRFQQPQESDTNRGQALILPMSWTPSAGREPIA